MSTAIGSAILDKLISDFAALKFANNVTIFNNVKVFYTGDSMESMDCLIIPDVLPETTVGESAGNTQTTRIQTFRIITFETIEASATNAEGLIKYKRLLNIADSILDYLQKEPSNLNSWGNSNNIAIYKIRVNQPRFDTQRTETGFAVILDLSFGIYLNIVPQNL